MAKLPDFTFRQKTKRPWNVC